jgi:hypothetical protein
MRIRLISVAFPVYRLQHDNGHVFDVRASRLDDGRLVFDPLEGWNDCCVHCQQDAESLAEDIDEVIYNATPEKFEE